MWYNNKMKTRPQRYQCSLVKNNYKILASSSMVNSRERLMNTQKKQKLRDLLIDRFHINII